jgi:hypothetical protein
MSNLRTITETGTLSDKQTVILDKPVPLPIGRVRVTVEMLPPDKLEGTFLSKLQAIRQALSENGYRPRTKAEIDTQIKDEREAWGN